MNKKKSLRVLVIALAVIIVFGVCSTVFAYDHSYLNLSGIVFGGAPQQMAYDRTQYSYPTFKLDAAYNIGNPGTWAMRGYNSYLRIEGEETTIRADLNRGGILYELFYTKAPNPYISIYQSVVSKNYNDQYEFSGTLKF